MTRWRVCIIELLHKELDPESHWELSSSRTLIIQDFSDQLKSYYLKKTPQFIGKPLWKTIWLTTLALGKMVAMPWTNSSCKILEIDQDHISCIFADKSFQYIMLYMNHSMIKLNKRWQIVVIYFTILVKLMWDLRKLSFVCLQSSWFNGLIQVVRSNPTRGWRHLGERIFSYHSLILPRNLACKLRPNWP